MQIFLPIRSLTFSETLTYFVDNIFTVAVKYLLFREMFANFKISFYILFKVFKLNIADRNLPIDMI